MILALDNSCGRGSVALVHNGIVVKEIGFENPRGRGGELFRVLEEILQDSPQLSRVVVGIGPGSYNGIRSAIGAAWGISSVRRVPLIGISSLLALDEGEFCAIGDARSSQFYFARVRDGAFLEAPRLVRLSELQSLTVNERVPVYSASELEAVPCAKVHSPSAVVLAKLGAGAEAPVGVPEPMYLKPAHITVAGK